MAKSNFRDLVVWQKAMDLPAAIYGVTESFPSSERFGLVAQLRRAAVRVASDIAGSRTRKRP